MEVLKVSFMKNRFLDILSETKLFVLERSTFILFKKIFKNISQFIYPKVGAFLTLFFFYHQGKL
jgi:hypothetical protein